MAHMIPETPMSDEFNSSYGEKKVYIRPYEMFMSEVDKSAYPNSTATFRFEKFIE